MDADPKGPSENVESSDNRDPGNEQSEGAIGFSQPLTGSSSGSPSQFLNPPYIN